MLYKTTTQPCVLFSPELMWTKYTWQWILIIKPTRCTNFSNLFLEQNSTCFGQFLCPSSGVFHCTHSNGICHTACEQDLDILPWSCSTAVSKPLWHIPLLYVQWKTPDDGQRNCPKHVEFYSKNKFEKLVHLSGLLTACKQDQDGMSWSCSQAVWHILLLCVQWKTPDDGHRNFSEHVEFYSKNKFEKLVHLVGFIIRIYLRFGIFNPLPIHQCKWCVYSLLQY